MNYRELFNTVAFATRRPDAENPISLRKRRRWFDGEGDGGQSDGNKPNKPNESANGGTGGDEQDSAESDGEESDDSDDSDSDDMDFDSLPESVKKYIQSLRKESAARRRQLRDLEKAEQKRKEEAETAETERLEKSGELQKVNEKLKGQIAEFKPYKERYEALYERLKKQTEARIARIPEDKRGLVPDYGDDLDRLIGWLDKNESTLVKPPSPNMDGGRRGNGAPSKDAKSALRKVSF